MSVPVIRIESHDEEGFCFEQQVFLPDGATYSVVRKPSERKSEPKPDRIESTVEIIYTVQSQGLSAKLFVEELHCTMKGSPAYGLSASIVRIENPHSIHMDGYEWNNEDGYTGVGIDLAKLAA